MSFRRNALRAGLGTIALAGLLLAGVSTPVRGLPHATAAAPGGTGAQGVQKSRALSTGAVPPGMQTATFRYAGTADPHQRLVATWARTGHGAPWVATVHGGSWYKGGWSDVAPAAAFFSRHGFAVFNVAYRLVTPAATATSVHWSDQRRDVLTALGWIRAHAAQFGIDPGRGALYGSSAGGNLALAAGLTGDGGNGIRGIVSVSGVVQPSRLWDDVRHRNPGERATPGIRRLAGLAAAAVGCPLPRRPVGGACAARWRAADVISAVSPHDPAVLLFQGDRDRTVPRQMAQHFRAQLDRANIGGSLVMARGIGHDQRAALDGGRRQAAMLAFVRARTAVAARPALSAVTVARRAPGTTRLAVTVRPRSAGVPVAGRVVATTGRTSVRAALTGGTATLRLPRATAGRVRVRYEGSPLLQPRVTTFKLRRK